MEYIGISENMLAKAESQLQRITLVNWNKNTEKFWSAEIEFKDAFGENLISQIFMC